MTESHEPRDAGPWRLPGPIPRLRPDQAGTGLLEVLLAISVISIGLLALASTVIFTTKLQRATKEKIVAYNACRDLVEQMQNYTFANLYKDYNADPADDSAGAGKGPGGTFTVSGLNGIGTAKVGSVTFPEDKDPVSGALVLREDVVDTALGMAAGRDLNGDGAIDAESHSADYKVLPVRITVSWTGVSGPQTLSVNALIVNRYP